jgi:peptidoglycan/xylan/chitin deacetylase (PgdA/CDA1 family)
MSFGGKMKAVTFSYDDGIFQDIRLVGIFKKYGLKCTFNLNSGIMTNDSKWECCGKPTFRINKSEIADVYTGHEIAMHFLTHPHPAELSDDELQKEIAEDIKNLEVLFNQKIVGSAYPYGEYDERIISALKRNGIKYARTVESTYNFNIQHNLLEFKPTCHHNDDRLMELAEEFVSSKPDKPMLFYIWGHSYEFDGYENWEMFEQFCKYISNRDDIFYGTNTEVFEQLDT